LKITKKWFKQNTYTSYMHSRSQCALNYKRSRGFVIIILFFNEYKHTKSPANIAREEGVHRLDHLGC